MSGSSRATFPTSSRPIASSPPSAPSDDPLDDERPADEPVRRADELHDLDLAPAREQRQPDRVRDEQDARDDEQHGQQAGRRASPRAWRRGSSSSRRCEVLTDVDRRGRSSCARRRASTAPARRGAGARCRACSRRDAEGVRAAGWSPAGRRPPGTCAAARRARPAWRRTAPCRRARRCPEASRSRTRVDVGGLGVGLEVDVDEHAVADVVGRAGRRLDHRDEHARARAP